MMCDAYIAGGTGLVGSHILATLGHSSAVRSISALGRRQFDSQLGPTTFVPMVDTDGKQWPQLLSSRLSEATESTGIFFSALGTTRAQAGGLENQRKIDHDLPVSLAQAFAARTVDSSDVKSVFVLISSANANPHAFFAYSKMKGETEEAIKALLKPEDSHGSTGLDHVIIVRPGLIVGQRRDEDSRPAEYAIRKVANAMGFLSANRAKDFWAQDAEIIARAAIAAGLQCAKGQVKQRVWIIGQGDIIRLGREEWKGT